MTSTPSRRRKPKLDPQLMGETEFAAQALADLVPAEQIGEHLSTTADDDRLVTHRFECLMPGYRGWTWFVTLSRASRSKVVTVCEMGVVAGEDSILAPEWLPWADRISEDEKQAADEQATQEQVAEDNEPTQEAEKSVS